MPHTIAGDCGQQGRMRRDWSRDAPVLTVEVATELIACTAGFTGLMGAASLGQAACMHDPVCRCNVRAQDVQLGGCAACRGAAADQGQGGLGGQGGLAAAAGGGALCALPPLGEASRGVLNRHAAGARHGACQVYCALPPPGEAARGVLNRHAAGARHAEWRAVLLQCMRLQY